VTDSTQPQCDIRFSICEGSAVASWTCEVEGTPVISCRACRAEWMRLAQSYPDLLPRCPRCARGRLGLAQRKPANQAPITGLVADAIDEAMRIEGVLINHRIAVLRRLAINAPWLDAWGKSAEERAPEAADQGGAGSAASAGRAGGEVGVLGSADLERIGV